ncbi:hypothetical protein BDN71DRAFT_998592 [Pleurotus eryngii]|uniref:Uncharacterized protein n=1 Tax=Pleurotus eryngii TaxID=5323 RepID=A0A9P5ZFR8_PLEER|nr:hypothetical protein BDN71DRAFT_998592 [Pleurotus eryngii]
MVIPPRVSNMSSSTAPSSSSPPPTSPHLPATLPLNLTPRKDTFSINGRGLKGLPVLLPAYHPLRRLPIFSIRTHASTSMTRTTHTARTTRTGYSGTGALAVTTGMARVTCIGMVFVFDEALGC